MIYFIPDPSLITFLQSDSVRWIIIHDFPDEKTEAQRA